MKRFLLGLRALIEGTTGFLLLVSLPFREVDIIRGQSPTRYMLGSLLVICPLFMVGILLFRDAIRLRLRPGKLPIS